MLLGKDIINYRKLELQEKGFLGLQGEIVKRRVNGKAIFRTNNE